MNCKCPDNVVRDVSWKFINKAWVAAITVCEQGLVTYTPIVESGDAMTLSIVSLPLIDVDEEGHYRIEVTPNTNRTVCQFENSWLGNIDLIVDSSNCTAGDELIYIFRIDTNVTIEMSNEIFYFEGGGDESLTLNASGRGTDRWVLAFTFDGEKFVYTYENC